MMRRFHGLVSFALVLAAGAGLARAQNVPIAGPADVAPRGPQSIIAGEAQTFTPLKAGEPVVVTTSGRSISGTIQGSGFPNWILVVEASTQNKVYIPQSSIQSISQPTAPRGDSAPGGPGAAPRKKYVVYVHGICRHKAGFSDEWWASMKPFTPDILDGSRREVVWSDLVNAPGAAPDSPGESERAKERIEDTLSDRVARERVDAVGSVAVGTEAPGGIFQNIQAFSCADDFVIYLTNRSIRNQIIERFNARVKPLLAEPGAEIEVICHSWGTVVAYEALRLMDGQPETPGKVTNLFTVGAALSIGEIRRRLLPEAADGARPKNTLRWINLNARHDVVGGPLQGSYLVDQEFLNLRDITCGSFLPDPICAHSSYFLPENFAVNRDIFARFIEP